MVGLLVGQELQIATTNPCPIEADICLSQFAQSTYGFPSAIRSRHLFCPVEGGKDTAANIPGAELRIIQGMGHDLPIPLAKTIAAAIEAAASRAAVAKTAK